MINRFYPDGLSQYRCILTRAAVQVIATGANTTIIWDAPTIKGSIFSYNAATGVLSVNQSGIYAISFYSVWAVSALGSRYNNIVTNDGLLLSHINDMITANFTTGNLVSSVNRLFQDAGTMNFNVLQSTGGNLNYGGSASARVEVFRLGDLT